MFLSTSDDIKNILQQADENKRLDSLCSFTFQEISNNTFTYKWLEKWQMGQTVGNAGNLSLSITSCLEYFPDVQRVTKKSMKETVPF